MITKKSNDSILWLASGELGLKPSIALKWQKSFIYQSVDLAGFDWNSAQNHEAGSFYRLDLSSVFLASILNDLSPLENRIIFDLCASPGGKSIYAWRLLQPDILISNEVIGKRLPALISNFKRCNIKPAIITCLDIKAFAQKFPAAADIVIVDAPCSGQSLLEKGQGYKSAFSPHVVKMNQKRQKSIIANASGCVAPGKFLAYMTCTFSEGENEKVAAWFLKRFPHFEPVKVECLEVHRSKFVDFPCYRLFPEDGLGAGGFTILFKNNNDGLKNVLSKEEIRCAWRSDIASSFPKQNSGL